MRRWTAILTTWVLLAGLVVQAGQSQSLVAEVRAAIARQDFARGQQLVGDDRAANGVTPQMLLALSWLGRGALGAGQFDEAERYARQTYDLALSELKVRPLDQEPQLPIALGAAIEVLAHVGAERGARSESVAFLRRELETYKDTSINKRIQKNINLLNLEGTAAPSLDLAEFLGPKPQPIDKLNGQVVILFFWAHWCSDCKSEAPVLADLASRYRERGLALMAPTQRYGYVAGGEAATADEEARYIDQVRQTAYGSLGTVSVPLAERNHTRYGVSTTPTLVVLDRKGLVRLYHPGRISTEILEPLVQRLLAEGTGSSGPSDE